MRRKNTFALLAAVALASALAACANPSRNEASTMPGADRDAHGCIGSAGYSWCEATQRCERPWELAKQKGFAVSEEQFARYCTSPSSN
ncbi:hypothetical protein [Paraburkholderia acidiphila]|uniref:hypothetical protein n=1 Tax=Paraburkholderia acidiphila TaxID=2571747 RepID=UPI001E2B826D|nr:hypothetical protein [Paraburkholderia acidiphila]